MVAALTLLFSVLAVIAVIWFLYRRRRGRHPFDLDDLIAGYRKDGGWIELCNVSCEPVFRGRIFTVLDDNFALAAGVLLEGKATADVVADLRSAGEPVRVGEGMILARCLINFNGEIVIAELNDEELKAALLPYLDPRAEAGAKLILDSTCVTANVNEAAFAEAWAKIGATSTSSP